MSASVSDIAVKLIICGILLLQRDRILTHVSKIDFPNFKIFTTMAHKFELQYRHLSDTQLRSLTGNDMVTIGAVWKKYFGNGTPISSPYVLSFCGFKHKTIVYVFFLFIIN